MNGRKLYREYAKYKGKDCCDFIKVKDNWDGLQEFEYKDSSGAIKKMNIHPADMIIWFIKSFSNEVWSSYKGGKHD
jgi:hypothetical protein